MTETTSTQSRYGYGAQDETLAYDPKQVVVKVCAGSGREIRPFQTDASRPGVWRWLVGDERTQFAAYRDTGGTFIDYRVAGN
jgi:hypothetical protein